MLSQTHMHNAKLDFISFGYRTRGLELGSRIQENYLNSLHDFRCTLISCSIVICGDDTSEDSSSSSGNKAVAASYQGGLPVVVRMVVLQAISSLSCLSVPSPLTIFMTFAGSTLLLSLKSLMSGPTSSE